MGLKPWIKFLTWRNLLDTVLYLSVLTLLLACHTNLIQPVGGIFSCTDNSIKHPFKGDTVSTKFLLAIVILLLLTIVSVSM